MAAIISSTVPARNTRPLGTLFCPCDITVIFLDFFFVSPPGPVRRIIDGCAPECSIIASTVFCGVDAWLHLDSQPWPLPATQHACIFESFRFAPVQSALAPESTHVAPSWSPAPGRVLGLLSPQSAVFLAHPAFASGSPDGCQLRLEAGFHPLGSTSDSGRVRTSPSLRPGRRHNYQPPFPRPHYFCQRHSHFTHTLDKITTFGAGPYILLNLGDSRSLSANVLFLAHLSLSNFL